MVANKKFNDLVDEKIALTVFFNSLLIDVETDVLSEIGTDTDFATNTECEVVNDESEVYALKFEENPVLPVLLPDIPIEFPGYNANEKRIEVVEHSDIKNNDEVLEDSANNITQKIVEPIKDERNELSNEFQIMMFTTAGLTLAVPLIELSGVINWPENITELPGHEDFYFGLVQHLDKQIPIIDIAKIVFPQERIASILDNDPISRVNRIVFINDFQWGLACDSVQDVINIRSDQIKWRKQNTSRAWLAGTVLEYMCALLDTAELSKLLSKGLK